MPVGVAHLVVTKVKINKTFQLIIANIFLSINFNMCLGDQKDSSFEYPQHMFWLKNKKNEF